MGPSGERLLANQAVAAEQLTAHSGTIKSIAQKFIVFFACGHHPTPFRQPDIPSGLFLTDMVSLEVSIGHKRPSVCPSNSCYYIEQKAVGPCFTSVDLCAIPRVD